jgi:flavodoxin
MNESKSLIIFYSWSGNTKIIAEYIKEFTNADIFEIKPVKPYPTNYLSCVLKARYELSANKHPKLKEYLNNINEYDTIYVGYPNWWGTLPMVIVSLLEKLDFTGKTVKPFVTSGSGGMGKSRKTLEELCKGAKIESELSIFANDINNSKSIVKNWIN